MARAPLTFKRSDVERAIASARKLGLVVSRIDVTREGCSVVLNDNDNVPLEQSALEAWKAKRNATRS